MTGVLIIDNFDSFVYNLYQYVGELGFKEVKVLRNNVSLPEIVRTDPERLIISWSRNCSGRKASPR
jgi:anthranilate/para-aminobenzoate synthase component II